MPLEKRVWEVMDNQFVSVTPETPLKAACAILSDRTQGKRETTLVVMRASGEYIGFLPARDILKYVMHLYHKSKKENEDLDWLEKLSDQCRDDNLITVNDVMVFYEVSLRPLQKLGEALELMNEYDLDVLPVLDAGKVLGLIRGVDILGEISRRIR